MHTHVHTRTHVRTRAHTHTHTHTFRVCGVLAVPQRRHPHQPLVRGQRLQRHVRRHLHATGAQVRGVCVCACVRVCMCAYTCEAVQAHVCVQGCSAQRQLWCSSTLWSHLSSCCWLHHKAPAPLQAAQCVWSLTRPPIHHKASNAPQGLQFTGVPCHPDLSRRRLRHQKHWRYVSQHTVAYWAQSYITDLMVGVAVLLCCPWGRWLSGWHGLLPLGMRWAGAEFRVLWCVLLLGRWCV